MNSESNMQNLEDLWELKNLCTRKLDKLVVNIDKYVKGTEYIYNVLSATSINSSHRSECITAEFIRDSFLSSLTNVLEGTLKLSGHLEAFNTEHLRNVPSLESLSKIDEGSLKNVLDPHGTNKLMINDVVEFNPSINSRCKLSSHSDISKSCSEITIPIFNSENLEHFRKDLNDFSANRVFNAIITWVDASFLCVCPHEWKETVLFISQSMEKLPKLEEYPKIPPNDEIFGILIAGDGFWRAIRISDVYVNNDLRLVFDIHLLDFGETLTIEHRAHICFKLPKQLREQPAQVIYCLLKDGITKDFEESLFKEITLRVIEMRKHELVVDVINNNNDCKNLDKSNESTPPNADVTSKLSKSDWEILREEPLNTSNALKAVIGYVPKDEQRICRFFDPKTGNCFKGASCFQEHTMLNKEGFTKDVLPTDTVVQNSITVYKKHTKLLITPTYIKSLTHFYAHIGEEIKESFCWKVDDLPYVKGLTHVPHTLEMVIAKFEDDLYYRAQILEQFNESLFKVFYVDYGNEGIVDVNDMALCDETLTYVPHQAVICRIAGVAYCENYSENQYEAAKSMLQSRLLDKTFVMKVIDHQEDLVVKFVEQSWKNFPFEMIELGYLQPHKD